MNNPGFGEIDVARICQILTNLANQLNIGGRFIEAREIWGNALSRNSAFWMARANRGNALISYASALYDSGHQSVFALVAHSELTQAIHDLDEHPELGDTSLRPIFVEAAESITQHFDLAAISADYRPNAFELGTTEHEWQYRQWCLRETLFLNPLNDLGPNPIAAQDVLTLPDFVTAIGDPPVFTGFFNQLKQEFVSARWLYFEGVNSEDPHISDRDVLLYNTLDYPTFGLAVEKVKIAFRMAYSLFDKIAYFLNHYLKLGIREWQVSFKAIWYERPGVVRKELEASENWPLRGLYWLSKDLFEKGFSDLTDPDARALDHLRNHLEHKYVKVHSMGVPFRCNGRNTGDLFFDHFAHSVSNADLEQRTLRLMKLVRSALIYLSLGMHREEKRRRKAAGSAVLIAPMRVDPWDDEWKRRW